MIVKFFELKKKNLNEFQFFLLYGNNRGLIEETCNKLIKPIKNGNIFTYDENEIIKNVENFEETILVKSFFDNEKIIIINRTTDKILKVIEANAETLIDEAKDFDPKVDDDFVERVIEFSEEIVVSVKKLKNLN